MSVKELYQSRAEHLTSLGQTITRIHSMSWTDWDLRIIGDLRRLTDPVPFLGDRWPGRDDLRVTDQRVSARPNNKTECLVTTVYSTFGQEFRLGRPDEVGSWNIELDSEIEEASVDAYIDADGNKQSWATKWSDQGAAYTEANRPELKQTKVTPVILVTVTSSKALLAIYNDQIGKINSSDFLNETESTLIKAQSDYESDFTGDDTEKWLLIKVKRHKKGSKVWEYRLWFRFNDDGWNTQHGVATNMYKTVNFNNLLNGMRNITTDLGGALSGR